MTGRRLLLLLLLLALPAGSRRPAAAAAPGGASPSAAAALSAPPDEADWQKIAQLLQDLSRSITAGRAEDCLALLAPTVGEDGRRELETRLTREFATVRWTAFRFTEDPRRHCTMLPSVGPGGAAERRLELRIVARYAYARLGPSSGGPSETLGEVVLTIERHGGRWALGACSLFPLFGQEGASRRAWTRYFWWVLGLLALLAVTAWAVIDCSIRYARWRWSLLVLLLPVAGPLGYLLFGWRRKRIPPTP